MGSDSEAPALKVGTSARYDTFSHIIIGKQLTGAHLSGVPPPTQFQFTGHFCDFPLLAVREMGREGEVIFLPQLPASHMWPLCQQYVPIPSKSLFNIV